MATTTAGTSLEMEMYDMKPLYKDLKKMELPTNMYHMKSLHGNENQEMVDPDLKTLVETEKKIATDLVMLTEELKELSHRLGHTFGEPAHQLAMEVKTPTPTVELPEGILDLVISVSPMQPALSAVLIGELLESCGIHVATPTHKHSSLKEDIPDHLLAATGGLSGRVQHNMDKLIFTYIWKADLFCPSLMHAPLLQTRIMGDANIARYLCRILYPQLYDETDIDAVVLTDKWIDTSVKMMNGNSKEKDAALKAMNSHLGRNDFFCGGNLTVADVTLLAALLTNSTAFKSLPNNVHTWFSRMRGLFGNTVSRLGVPETWCEK